MELSCQCLCMYVWWYIQGCCSWLEHSSSICESLKVAIVKGEAHTAQRRKFIAIVSCVAKGTHAVILSPNIEKDDSILLVILLLLLVCVAFTGMVLSCITAFIRKQADRFAALRDDYGGGDGDDGHDNYQDDDGGDDDSSDLLFTRLLKVLQAILPSFGSVNSVSGVSSCSIFTHHSASTRAKNTHTTTTIAAATTTTTNNNNTNANNSIANNKGYEKSFNMLLNVISSKKLAHAVATLGAP